MPIPLLRITKLNLKEKDILPDLLPLMNEQLINIQTNRLWSILLIGFLNPNIKRFFRNGGIEVDEEQWALAELIQWVWRGSIRNGKPMNLFIPSKRMRELLLDWLDGKNNNASISKAAWYLSNKIVKQQMSPFEGLIWFTNSVIARVTEGVL